ncbi:hypothetical protein [Erwinia amylovora]|uniref:hypothetical protein n=1 Tax=Erwinia amylovora TaxID=552 RepID=UPI001F03F6E5|nr:hypothetical protein [Erwinia amylovora]
MPNDIKPEITPRFHIHYNLTDNTSAGASRPNVIWLALDISQSSEQLTPKNISPPAVYLLTRFNQPIPPQNV